MNNNKHTFTILSNFAGEIFTKIVTSRDLLLYYKSKELFYRYILLNFMVCGQKVLEKRSKADFWRKNSAHKRSHGQRVQNKDCMGENFESIFIRRQWICELPRRWVWIAYYYFMEQRHYAFIV